MRKFLALFIMATSTVMTHKINRRCCDCPAEPKVIVGRRGTDGSDVISFGQGTNVGSWRQDVMPPSDTCCPCTAKDMYPFILPDVVPD